MTEKKWKHATVGNVIHDPWQASFLWQIYHFTFSCVRGGVNKHGNIYLSGGNLGGAGGGETAPPPPPPSRKMTNFRKFWPKRGLKTAFSSANGGGGGRGFVGNLGGFAPPPEEVNFRHWPPFVCKNHRLKNFLCTCRLLGQEKLSFFVVHMHAARRNKTCQGNLACLFGTYTRNTLKIN